MRLKWDVDGEEFSHASMGVRIARYQMLQPLLLHENLLSAIHVGATVKDLMVDATAQGGWPEYELVIHPCMAFQSRVKTENTTNITREQRVWSGD